ncbi:pLS20_p028 family conjugation system transmembrane protein [Virgibacillus salexigens]|uniref:pLS20_p028 family conjugation system transmembrane protein n=1 Tax=Virgibacillus massiliensis TaxID=1462526 RepID=UPI001368C521|nr:hypothetical protein [Virgibacillus massiliensis]MYL43968.1 hypothetical protein [Virgibacillus massiliensis]
MSKEEILEKLVEFGEYLTEGTIIQDTFRWLLWMITIGLAWIVDALEDVANNILGLKLFYENPDFVDFIESFQPVLVILFALNILFIGYLLIFQKKFNREGVLTNIIMALIILVLLGSGMQQADRFSTQAINAIDTGGNGKMGSEVITKNITDVSLFDLNGWETPELEEKNNIQNEYATSININSYLTEGSEITPEEKLSSNGEDILSHKIETLGDGTRKVVELEDGNWISDITQEYYYRYTVDWFNIIATLLIVAVVLVTISVKLAQLFFELAFNQALATFIAPSDMHSGQKMKAVVQNILSIFIVMIMIFLSMKIYLIGSEWIGENFDGLVYLVAMLGFARAVIDGPNIVERLFGIDAGIKSGWGAIAGTYALAKGASSVTKGLGQGAKNVASGAGKMGNSVANKSASAMGGMAGLTQGLKDNENQGNEANNNKTDSNMNNANENGQQQSDSSTSENTSESSSGSMEENQGDGGHNPSLQDEMNANSEEGNQNKSDKPQSLHEEMKQKGYESKSNPARGASGFVASQVADQGNANSSSMASGGNQEVASTTEGYTGSGSKGSNTPPPSSSPSNESVPLAPTGNSDAVERRNESNHIQEDRHVGQVIRDNFSERKQNLSNSRMAQNTKRSYQVGRNTGKVIKKNVKKNFKK